MKRVVLVAGCSMVLLAGCSAAPSGTPGTSPAPVDVPSAPTSLSVNAGAAPVDSVQVSDGVLHPPEDVNRLAWWKDSALPGTAGTTVITGHVNLRGTDGFAKQFIDLKPGTPIDVVTADGDVESYAVTEVSNYNKAAEFPLDKLNALSGPEVLALITCGGEFVGPPFGYEDNVIAWATPTD